MKKFLLIPLLVTLMFSCKKEDMTNKSAGSQEKKPFKISIADFITQEGNLKSENGRTVKSTSGRNGDLSQISNVYYVAYASDGSRVNFIHQDSINNSSNFGVISDSLIPGTYSIVLIAAEKPLTTAGITDYGNNINTHYFSAPLVGAMGMYSMGDAFYKKTQITISETGNVTNIEMALDRIVGMLEINILDALPSSAENGSIYVKLNPVTADFFLKNDAPGAAASWIDYVGTRQTQHTFREYMLGSNNPFSVSINYKDKITGADLVKTIDNVKCSANKKTIISGYLYGVPGKVGSPDYQVKLNQAWSTDSTIIKF